VLLQKGYRSMPKERGSLEEVRDERVNGVTGFGDGRALTIG